MKSASLLRVSAILSLVQGVAHGALVLTFHPTHGPAEVDTVAAMRAHVFNFGGFHHTYWDMYFGYELFVVVGCFLQAALLFLLAPLATAAPRLTSPVIALLTFANLAYAVLMVRYFFLAPLSFDVLIAVVLFIGFLAARREVSS
jgi:hypothetical protein